MFRQLTFMMLAAAAAAPLHGQTTMTTTQTLTTTSGNTCYDKAAVAGFTVEPAQPALGQSATIRLKIKNGCASAANVPWKIYVAGNVVGSGTASVPAGATIDATAGWTAKLGAYEINAEIDPNNTLGESTSAQNNNLPTVINLTVNGDWSGWKTRVRAALGPAIQEWFTKAQFKDVRVNSPGAFDGYLAGPGIDAMLKSRIVAAGVPADVADAFAYGINDKWSQWRASVKFPSASLPMFVHPVPYATTKLPSTGAPPMGSMQQNTSALSASSVSQAITSRLGGAASLSGASAAINEVAQSVYVCYLKINAVPVINLMATGYVLSNNPWTVPAAMFTGKAEGLTPGHIVIPSSSFC